ncbi:hypothetical protein ACDH50_14520 [Xanthomonas fragariae]
MQMHSMDQGTSYGLTGKPGMAQPPRRIAQCAPPRYAAMSRMSDLRQARFEALDVPV